MQSANSNTSDEEQISTLMDERVKAVLSKDVETLTAQYAPDVLSFDTVDALQNSGLDAIRTRAEAWFASFQSSIGYEVRDLVVAIGEGVAFSHSFAHINGTLRNGTLVDMWVRTTLGYQKLNGHWVVTHEHTSVPFDGESGKALLDLKPS